MFWKKKQSDSIFLIHEKNEKRSSFRYITPENESLIVRINNDVHDIINISATGIAFKNKHLKQGEGCLLNLDFPGKNLSIQVSATILSIDNENICHCEFLDLSAEQEENIHQYVFERQMKDLRNNR